MGGTSTQQQSSNQQSQLTPYAPAQAGLQGILSGLDPSIANLGITPQVTSALNQIEQNSTAPNVFSAPATNAVSGQLNGGANYGAASNIVSNGNSTVNGALSPFLTGNSLDPSSNPALAAQLGAVNTQVQNTVNPMMSAAGRLGSPANAQAMAAGIAQGDAPILQNAASNAISAAGTAGNNANNAGGVLGNLDAGNSGIMTAGLNNSAAAYGMPNLGAQNSLMAALTQSQLPIQNASSLSGILGPIAAQFGQQTGSGTQTGSSTMSPVQQFAALAQGFGSLFAGPTNAAGQASTPVGNFSKLIFS